MDITPILTPGPARLRAAYEAEGFHVWLVGGAVRALLLGETPADIDLCTDQSARADRHLRVAPAPLHPDRPAPRHHHGGVDREPFEVATLRTETDHDGRHTEVHTPAA